MQRVDIQGKALMTDPVLCSGNTTLVSGAVLRTRSTTQKKTRVPELWPCMLKFKNEFLNQVLHIL